jgi:hypothetical protein
MWTSSNVLRTRTGSSAWHYGWTVTRRQVLGNRLQRVIVFWCPARPCRALRMLITSRSAPPSILATSGSLSLHHNQQQRRFTDA